MDIINDCKVICFTFSIITFFVYFRVCLLLSILVRSDSRWLSIPLLPLLPSACYFCEETCAFLVRLSWGAKFWPNICLELSSFSSGFSTSCYQSCKLKESLILLFKWNLFILFFNFHIVEIPLCLSSYQEWRCLVYT